MTPPQNRRDARRCTRPQEAERQTPPHPPAAHVWPAVLLPRPASGQEKQVIARMTASGQASDPESVRSRTTAPHPPTGRETRMLTAGAVAGKGPRPLTPRESRR